MFELGESQLFVLDPEEYVVAGGLALGNCNSMEDENGIKLISLVFIDIDGAMHPIMMPAHGHLIRFLLSDSFRNSVTEMIEKSC